MYLNLIYLISEKCDFYTKINLKKVNRELYSIVRIIKIPDDLMYKLTDDILQNLPYLQELNLENNESITDDGIEHLSNLQSLCLNDNITDNSIKKLLNLKALSLGNNNEITTDSIKHLSKLEEFNLCCNKSIVDNDIKDLFNLKILNLGINYNITDDGIKNLLNLQKMDIYDNDGITYKSIKKLSNLQELYFELWTENERRTITGNNIKGMLDLINLYLNDNKNRKLLNLHGLCKLFNDNNLHNYFEGSLDIRKTYARYITFHRGSITEYHGEKVEFIF